MASFKFKKMTTMATIAQQLKIKYFPFEIKDSNGNLIYRESSNGYWIRREYDFEGNIIYHEDSNGYWYKREFDSNGKEIYYENANGDWFKIEYDSKGNKIYFENSRGYWYKCEYDSKGNRIYYENSDGKIIDNRPKIELTLDEIAKKFGIPVNQLKIKK